MGFGIVEILILGALCCVPLVVLIGIIAGVVFLNKRLSQPSWFRKILAVVTGVIVDLGGTNIVAGIYTAILAFSMAAGLAQQNLSPTEMQERLFGELTNSSITTSIPMIVFGILLSILGGYVAGKIARQNEVVYGFLTGIGVLLVSVTLTFLMGLPTEIKGPFWQLALNLAANIGATTLGGYFAFLQRKRKQANLMASNPDSPQVS